MSLLKSIESGEINAIMWLKVAHEKVGNKGFAHSRRNYLPARFAWRASYPETSGYLIENLLNFNKDRVEQSQSIAMRTANWLYDLKSSEGYYYSGLGSNKPSSFNTAQIIFGLLEAFEFTKDQKYLEAARHAKSWILSTVDSNGIWIDGLFKPNYFATYYSRAIWPTLLIADNSERVILSKSLQVLWDKRTNSQSFNDLGFSAGSNFLTHTIAYALEGFFESAIILEDQEKLNKCVDILEFIAKKIIFEGSLSGIYDSNWNSMSKSKCVTGQAQFSSLFAKVYLKTSNTIFEETSVFLMRELLCWQVISKDAEHNGAFSASRPSYGNYFPFQYVNWTNKFFLDACYQMKKFL